MTGFIEGDKVCLRPMHPSDAVKSYPDWLNDEEVCKYNSHHVFPYTEQEALNHIREWSGSKRAIVLAIIANVEDQYRHIGNIALQRINYINRSAELSIIIGVKDAWGKGYGTEAVALMLRHAFYALNMHSVYLGHAAGNVGMARIAAKLGMMNFGIARSVVFKDGEYIDVYLYDILKSEFTYYE